MTAPLLLTLRRLLHPPPRHAKCDLCHGDVPETHAHVVDTQTRRILCACAACSASERAERYRRVSRRVVHHASMTLSRAQWQALAIPVDLAFFFVNSALGRAVACYPGPAGATEAQLPGEVWTAVEDESPWMRNMTPDVEALLVRKMDGEYRCFIVPIDACYELVGRIRTQWSGFRGGDAVLADIDAFFADLLADSHVTVEQR
jgi:hypothetical protein